MHGRRIRLAGALLLTSLLLSLAEAAWAATCDPSMATSAAAEAPAATDMMAMPGMADMPGMPAGHDCPPGHAHDPDGSGRDDAPCPFTAPGGLGCAASASLPAGSADVKEPPAVKALSERSSLAISPALQTRSIFHPPRA